MSTFGDVVGGVSTRGVDVDREFTARNDFFAESVKGI
jgi:hypothetical protein